ncbi:TetR/AcrR family transcriptional regulator [Companilactobacillus allii]|uniref:TetR family transcriptional regulator n=1 Tax=Companilactobacillus allii TaxID=1847728 RepID=A0A1P8Q0K4_9LACO|nr:TetR/AcrR family transcriptional regulator [Companilactobacillus allii]APX71355.1 TetR family transcriptional regulator [Companilactobacillus allii]USQ68436.1 TetR/AcrR family transcriptional regulator [Companilactobacillus allii]
MVGIKNNRRAQYTRKVIQDAVLSLLESKTINNITVTEVCKLADINRTTFYRYFDDVYGCVDNIEAEFLESLNSEMVNSPMQGMEMVLNEFYHHKRLSNLVFVEGKTRLLEKLFENFDPINLDIDAYQEVYLMAGLQSVLKKWVKDGMKLTPHKLTGIIIPLVFADNIQEIRPLIRKEK